MKIFIIGVILTFIISAGITIFLTGTFNQPAPEKSEATETKQLETKQSGSVALAGIKQEDIQQEKASENQASENNDNDGNNTELDKMVTDLEQYKAQVEVEKAKLDAIKLEIESLNNLKSSITNGQQLAKVYGSMKPDAAASVLCELEETMTIQILTQMNSSTSAKIMDAIAKKNPEYAAKISKNMISDQ